MNIFPTQMSGTSNISAEMMRWMRLTESKTHLKIQKTAHYDTLMFYEIEDVLEDVAPADVAPVVNGRWIWKPTKQYCPSDCWYPPLSCEETWNEKDGTWLEDEMYCSECDYHNYHEIKYNFCPNCGADMRGEQE